MPKTHIKNLVLEGGGVKGIAYVSAIQKLSDMDVLGRVEQVTGTSVGAITTYLLSLRNSTLEINEIIYGLDFKSFEDHKNPLRIISKYGLYAGDAFLAWLRNLIAGKYIRSLFDTLFLVRVVEFENNSHEMLETICIDDLGVSATDFSLTGKIKRVLIQQGNDVVEKHFA